MNPFLREKKKCQLVDAISFLQEVLNAEKDRITTAAAVQAFEMALELSWRWLKLLLEEKGIPSTTPKEVVRLAGQYGLIDCVEDWLEFIDARNLTSHTYNQQTADEIYELAKSLQPAAARIVNLN